MFDVVLHHLSLPLVCVYYLLNIFISENAVHPFGSLPALSDLEGVADMQITPSAVAEGVVGATCSDLVKYALDVANVTTHLILSSLGHRPCSLELVTVVKLVILYRVKHWSRLRATASSMGIHSHG